MAARQAAAATEAEQQAANVAADAAAKEEMELLEQLQAKVGAEAAIAARRGFLFDEDDGLEIQPLWSPSSTGFERRLSRVKPSGIVIDVRC